MPRGNQQCKKNAKDSRPTSQSSDNGAESGSEGGGTVTIDRSIVKEMMSKIDNLSIEVKKIDNLAAEVAKMNNSVAEMKKDILSLKSLKDDVAHISTVSEENKSASALNTENVAKLSNELKEAKATIDDMKSTCSNLKEHQLSLDSYMRRDNLLFENIPEDDNEGLDCRDRIFTFMKDELKMDPDVVSKIMIVRCHRLGRKPQVQTQKRPRTIICRFHYYGYRQEVWNKRSNLAGKAFRLSEDFPKEIVSRRNMLAPIMFEARRQGSKASMVADKLIIDNNNYTVGTLGTLPASLDPFKVSTRLIGEKSLEFYGSLSPLSNFHPAAFQSLSGIKYKHTEQHLHHNKALLFDDQITAAKIMASDSPSECKSLGNKVKNFNLDKWKTSAKDIMKAGLMCKFSQNPRCFKALELTGKRRIIEASPWDTLWGVGLSMKDENLGNENYWKGANWMGNTLEEVRTELITG
jgi:ribA/ribD-fused uncharacterized protein